MQRQALIIAAFLLIFLTEVPFLGAQTPFYQGKTMVSLPAENKPRHLS
ncbi:MAG: hypothetical protein HYV00_07695 [Deltaproteobacteria bacterium]|nr:hypothetical protein [Deltaproteobacteria bacterium]